MLKYHVLSNQDAHQYQISTLGGVMKTGTKIVLASIVTLVALGFILNNGEQTKSELLATRQELAVARGAIAALNAQSLTHLESIEILEDKLEVYNPPNRPPVPAPVITSPTISEEEAVTLYGQANTAIQYNLMFPGGRENFGTYPSLTLAEASAITDRLEEEGFSLMSSWLRWDLRRAGYEKPGSPGEPY